MAFGIQPHEAGSATDDGGTRVHIYSSEELAATFGYHPIASDHAAVLGVGAFNRLLVLDAVVPDVVDSIAMVRAIKPDDLELPRGLYWFAGIPDPIAMLVKRGSAPMDSHSVRVEELAADDALSDAFDWAKHLWELAKEVPNPRFRVGSDVITVPGGQDAVIRGRSYAGSTWSYEVRLHGRTQHLLETQLEHLPDVGDDPAAWPLLQPAPAERFGATLTRGKLEGQLTSTVFSFRATRTVFRPYQFKPVLKLLQTGATRILIADEVGLGKTIEAGLIWTEFEARRQADRVLIITPSSLVGKWQEEMAERFGFTLAEMDGKELDLFLKNFREGRLPPRFALIASVERLRTWEGLGELADFPPQFDLIIVDEAHSMRNEGTKSHALGQQINDWADARVFLTATPVNLGNRDLANLLELLAPEDFDDPEVLALRLEPNAVLHELEALLLDKTANPSDRLAVLDRLNSLVFGPALMSRPDFTLLRDLVARTVLSPADIVEARRHLAELNALSSVITRTRKVEIDERKALREPQMVSVSWTNEERHFYEEYVNWCVARAEAAEMPLHFAMQMPLRLASACLPAARATVLGSASEGGIRDEDAEGQVAPTITSVGPHHALVSAAKALDPADDSKFDRLLPLVRDLVKQNRQGLLFTFSRPTLAYLERRLAPHARVAVMHGGIDRADRRRIMADFRDRRYDVLLANRVASEGLDFEFCSAVINYDLPWNPMEVEQRIGRIDRIGQPEEKILVINFYNEETIDERILTRVLERIGVFERAIGALEPIIQSQLKPLQEAVFDFALNQAEREFKADQILTAIEAKRVEAERLAGATSDLLVSNDVDVAGLEHELVRTGRYVGQRELALLLDDWAKTANAPGVTFPRDSVARLRGNPTMARQLMDVAARGTRTRTELGPISKDLQSEIAIHLVLDQEEARTTGGDLLTATHPLVLAALAVPGHRQARFAHVAVHDSEGIAQPGGYAVLLGVASGGGDRPTRDLWGAAVDLSGRDAPTAVADLLLAALAGGSLEPAIYDGDPRELAELIALAADQLRVRHDSELQRRSQEAAALVESRRLSIEEQFQRKLHVIDKQLATAQSRGTTTRLFDGKRTRAHERHDELLHSLTEQREAQLSLAWLAACYMEVRR